MLIVVTDDDIDDNYNDENIKLIAFSFLHHLSVIISS